MGCNSGGWVRTAAPTSVEGLEKYLASGLLKGIAPTSPRLVAAFGARSSTSSRRAGSVARRRGYLPAARATRISEGWRSQRAVREIMVFRTGSVGTSAPCASQYLRRRRDRDPARQPYRLARDVHGIGFVVADTMAATLGIAGTAMIRVRAASATRSTRRPTRGTVAARDGSHDAGGDLLRCGGARRRRHRAGAAAGALVRDSVGGDTLISWPTSRRRTGIAQQLGALAMGTRLPAIDTARALAWVAPAGSQPLTSQAWRSPTSSAPSQLALARRCSCSPAGPSSQDDGVADDPPDSHRQARASAAVRADGRAARRLAEVTGLEARTIHRLSR